MLSAGLLLVRPPSMCSLVLMVIIEYFGDSNLHFAQEMHVAGISNRVCFFAQSVCDNLVDFFHYFAASREF